MADADAPREVAGHDNKGFSEEKCIRCGWVMGHPPLNCQNDDTPHVFPSQIGSWSWKYDSEARASYLRLSRGEVERTFAVGPYQLDLDRHGRVLGVEALHPPVVQRHVAGRVVEEPVNIGSRNTTILRDWAPHSDEGGS